jgi:8-oxo-dGTP pyrophosphatase MutT (NUDIX family)
MRFKMPVTVHLLFLRGDHILMLRRFQTGYEDGKYSVPAGHLDGGEPVRLAAIREAKEEVGLDLQPQYIHFAGVFHRCSDAERVDFFVTIEKWSGEPFNAEPDKCDDLLWVGIDHLPENTIPYVRKAIENWRAGIPFEEFGWDSSI